MTSVSVKPISQTEIAHWNIYRDGRCDTKSRPKWLPARVAVLNLSNSSPSECRLQWALPPYTHGSAPGVDWLRCGRQSIYPNGLLYTAGQQRPANWCRTLRCSVVVCSELDWNKWFSLGPVDTIYQQQSNTWYAENVVCGSRNMQPRGTKKSERRVRACSAAVVDSKLQGGRFTWREGV